MHLYIRYMHMYLYIVYMHVKIFAHIVVMLSSPEN